MSSVTKWLRVAGVWALLWQCCDCIATTALSVTPSTSWYGDDGSWSAISIRVGSPPQWVDVLVNTISSETWVVGSGGCMTADSTCISSRGNIFNHTKSTTWQDQGLFTFAVDARLGGKGYADYGLDNLTFGTTGVVLPSAIIGEFNGTGSTNSTQYLLGLFGLGVTPGNFTTFTPLSAISALVEDEGAISSHSYGYTAGAKYQLKGVPNSLTLGGYDANRFVPHNITFSLNPSQQPEAYINSISVISASGASSWNPSIELLHTSDRVSAIVDSSTPFLWLPQDVCDRFASSFGLSYDSTINLYTFDANASMHAILSNSELTFTFNLTDTSSATNFVNISLPYSAFDLQLTYPAIPSTTFGASNSTKYYFPLRQAADAAQYTIGRAFLQEAYLITDYERNTFSVHQAIHTADAITNTSIVPIPRSLTSPFTGPPTTTNTTTTRKLSVGTIVGIAVGAFFVVTLSGFLAIRCFSRKAPPKSGSSSSSLSMEETTPTSIFSRLFRRSSQAPVLPVHEATGSTAYPTEVGADLTHERYELAAPLGPAELDSESGTLEGTTENGSSTQDSANLSAYERARRKLERRLTAAAKAQRESDNYSFSGEKNEVDISPVAHYRPSDHENPPVPESPLVSPLESTHGGFFSSSPVSPGFVSAPTSPISPPPVYSRTGDRGLVGGNVVYVGRLPGNVRLPRMIPRIIGPDGRTIPNDEGTSSSLGSGFTEDEERVAEDLYGSGDTVAVSPIISRGSGSGDASISPLASSGSGSGSGSNGTNLVSPISGSTASSGQNHRRVELSDGGRGLREREIAGEGTSEAEPVGGRGRLRGEDLVHVPQVAENRFSWEEERI